MLVFVISVALAVGVIVVVWNQPPAADTGLDAADMKLISRIRVFLQDECGLHICAAEGNHCERVPAEYLRAHVIDSDSPDENERFEKILDELRNHGSKYFIETQDQASSLYLFVKDRYANRPIGCVIRQFVQAYLFELTLFSGVLVVVGYSCYRFIRQKKIRQEAKILEEKTQIYLRNHKRRYQEQQESFPYVRVDQLRDSLTTNDWQCRYVWPVVERSINQTSLIDKTHKVGATGTVAVWEWIASLHTPVLPVNRKLVCGHKYIVDLFE